MSLQITLWLKTAIPTSVTGEMWHLLVPWKWDVTAWTEQSVGMSWELLWGGSRCRGEG